VKRWLLVALVALVPVALLAVVRPDGRPPLPAGPPGELPATRPRVSPAPPAVDLDTMRDIFRFENADSGVARAAVVPPATPAVTAPAPPEIRLVGLVRRGPRLLAALALADDVFVLGAGDSAAGYAVLEVSDEGVRLRDPQGHEEDLALP
jgi:hypothetical protein